MVTKLKSHPLNGPHTAGIFADMTVDGPEIGTLVLIIDRAKNLPNRKTIGKQDPYCAARLGKEARKTKTDVRGGQTPRWDQELRFKVHDCPDYYQLKVSVFNDDKKTDLIGETWVDLKDVIVPGGGQNDLWHNLSYRGKYAGEIRIEITFYDSRPKPEKPVIKTQVPEAELPAGGSQQRSPMKRRPLPFDPVTGESPPSQIPDQHVAPRAHPMQPAYIPNHSPLQTVEYGTPQSLRFSQPEHYSPTPQQQIPTTYTSPQGHPDLPPQPPPRMVERYDNLQLHFDDRDYTCPPQQHDPPDRLDPYDRAPDHQGPRYIDGPVYQLPTDEDTPPPPPVHRSRNNSGNAHEMILRNSYDTSPTKGTPPMRHDVLRNEAQRNSVPAYPGRPTFRPYDTAPAVPHVTGSSHDSMHPSPPRHHSYDSIYDTHHRSMQPSIDDAPESPTALIPTSFRSSANRRPQSEEPDYEANMSPAPLNLSGRGSAASGHFSPSPHPSQQHHFESNGYHSPTSLPHRDLAQSSQVSRNSESSQRQYANYRNELDGTHIHEGDAYALPPVPSSLVPGVDPVFAREIQDRIYEERRQETRYAAQKVATPPRGRQRSEPPNGHAPGSSPLAFTPPLDRHARSSITFSNGPPPQVVKPKAVSPIPSPESRHTIRRKSVSPAPPTSDGRMLPGMPFGPDSYDALNSSFASTKSQEQVKPDLSDPNAKIILHDGREVDPSDHLPMESWAPEPEPRERRVLTPDSRPHPSPMSQAPSPGGRRALRVAGRPKSMGSPATYITPEEQPLTPPAPSSGGRNRLQKRAHRTSAMPISTPAAGSSPLAPISSHNYQDNGGSGFTPPRLPRAGTWDYPSENHAPQYGTSPSGMPRNGPPAVPAKIPLPIMSGALVPAKSGRGGSVNDDWALMEEMRTIDIGSGRSRRHGGY